MKTITIDESTKAGKMLLELAIILAGANEGVCVESADDDIQLKKLKTTTVKTRDLSSGKTNTQVVQSFLDKLGYSFY